MIVKYHRVIIISISQPDTQIFIIETMRLKFVVLVNDVSENVKCKF